MKSPAAGSRDDGTRRGAPWPPAHRERGAGMKLLDLSALQQRLEDVDDLAVGNGRGGRGRRAGPAPGGGPGGETGGSALGASLAACASQARCRRTPATCGRSGNLTFLAPFTVIDGPGSKCLPRQTPSPPPQPPPPSPPPDRLAGPPPFIRSSGSARRHPRCRARRSPPDRLIGRRAARRVLEPRVLEKPSFSLPSPCSQLNILHSSCPG